MFKRTLIFGIVLFFLLLLILSSKTQPSNNSQRVESIISTPTTTPTPTPTPVPISFTIPLQTHVFQTFNNCGPATLSMALSYVEVRKTQHELGKILRPYQIPGGDNDDKSVTLEEVASLAREYGLHSYLRPNGTIETIKKLISNDIVVVARTWLKADEDIGHYRVIRGYDDNTGEFIQDDSLQNKNLHFSYENFLTIWRPFNYEYLVIIDDSKKEIVENILAEEVNERTAWNRARIRIEKERLIEPDNKHLTFALSRIYYYLENYEKSVNYFNEVENKLSPRTLWYQIEPISAIYEIADYDRLFKITDRILSNDNRAFTELYILRGKAYENLSNIKSAKKEYEQALLYNANSKEAISALTNL